jgi:hypothetical protein
MSVRSTLQNIFTIGSALFTLGFVMMAGGCIQTLGFLHRVPTFKEITVRILMRELIIPHMIMLFGTGLLVARVISMTHRKLIQMRMKDEAI